ncbi:hypothetical protein GA0074695_0367 [Micromonospora viridifaciens]|uniref:DUF7144 domain-containing protein n=1 Tax=Micromonospora viridifaciens TaxID=1881 RepID=A0A1C4UCN5_MICVI|nr:hypothetical protein [Micromonospora viridifaciens]SCE69412.1 hypothetical protein GA0074695_0367 [Micromonospora viridifaciens]
MTRHDEARLRRRRRWLAGVLLAGAGFFDGLAGVSDLDNDKYVVQSEEGLLHLDLTGWSWAHQATGALMVLAGVLLFTARPWSVRLAVVAAVAGIVLHLILLPFEPVWAVIVIGLAVAPLRLLWLCRRRRGARADDVNPAGRPAR